MSPLKIKLVVILPFFSAVLFCMYSLVAHWGQPGLYSAIIILALSTIVCVGFLLIKENGLASPISVLMISLFVGLICKLIYIDLNFNDVYVKEIVLLRNEKGIMLRGVFLIFVAVACFVAGYMVVPAKKSHFPGVIYNTLNYDALMWASLALLGVGFVAVFLFVGLFGGQGDGGLSGKRFLELGIDSTNRFGEFGYYLYKVTFLLKISFYLSVVGFMFDKNRTLLFSLLMVTSFVLFCFSAFYFSNRLSIIMVTMEAGAIVYLCRWRPGKKVLMTAAALPIFLVVAASEMRSSGASTKDLADHLFGGFYYLDVARNSHLYSYMADHKDFLSNAFGDGFFSVYFNLGKISGYYVFHREFAGVPVGFPMELFMVGGWALLIVGMTLAGIGMRLVSRSIIKSRINVIWLVCYSIIFVQFMTLIFNNGLGAALISIMTHLIPLLGAFWGLGLLFRKRSKDSYEIVR